MASAAKKPDRLRELQDRIKSGTYRVDSWNLAQLLLAHPEARDALGLPPVLSHRAPKGFSRRAS